MNGVPYRSVNGDAEGVKRLTKELPSAWFHRQWLLEILYPLAKRGERFVCIHRWGLWNGAADVLLDLPNVRRSKAPIGPDLTPAEWSAVQGFLA